MAEQIFSTKGNLIACKKNLELAKLGFDLLDRKRNVLMREMMKLIDVAADMQKRLATPSSGPTRAAKRQYHAGHRPSLDSVVPEERGFPCTGTASWG